MLYGSPVSTSDRTVPLGLLRRQSASKTSGASDSGPYPTGRLHNNVASKQSSVLTIILSLGKAPPLARVSYTRQDILRRARLTEPRKVAMESQSYTALGDVPLNVHSRTHGSAYSIVG